jgi:hypothetical protein
VVVEGRLVGLGELLAVLLDVRRILDLLPGHRHLQVIRTNLDPAQRNEGQVPADQALLDGAEPRLIGLDVDVDVLQLADLSPSRSMSIFPCHSARFHIATPKPCRSAELRADQPSRWCIVMLLFGRVSRRVRPARGRRAPARA